MRSRVARAHRSTGSGAEVMAPRRARRACEEAERGAGAPASDEPGCGAAPHVRMKLSEPAERLDCRLEGDGDVEIIRVASIRQAVPGDLTFLANPKYAGQLRETRASAVILGRSSPERNDVPPTCAVVRSADPYTAYARALDFLGEPHRPAIGVHELTVIGADVVLGSEISIGPFVTVGDG